ncbi:hypothetical protein [Sphingomonas jatrophae]|uniref:Uncharacterized protein n=1 Tax=Sphingomonas jatrophae TaxID=1166337 RepID=A0A1I6M4R8_9SPHN|nr:hypothetical protein [Sphingomonas jatrophae]SFS10686.1 hypothetical protein SAMN05192580_3452 [Sphingomonas jatrophae]
MAAMPMRFADVRLGQTVHLEQVAGMPLADRLCEMVRRWSGTEAASLVWMQLGDDDLDPEELASHVMARHVDGSNRADVEVVMRGRGVAGRAVVRVELV